MIKICLVIQIKGKLLVMWSYTTIFNAAFIYREKTIEAKQTEAIWEGRDQSAVWTSLDERDNSRNSESTSSFLRGFSTSVYMQMRVNERKR